MTHAYTRIREAVPGTNIKLEQLLLLYVADETALWSVCPSCDTDGQLQSHCNLGGGGVGGEGGGGRAQASRGGVRMDGRGRVAGSRRQEGGGGGGEGDKDSARRRRRNLKREVSGNNQ